MNLNQLVTKYNAETKNVDYLEVEVTMSSGRKMVGIFLDTSYPYAKFGIPTTNEGDFIIHYLNQDQVACITPKGDNERTPVSG